MKSSVIVKTMLLSLTAIVFLLGSETSYADLTTVVLKSRVTVKGAEVMLTDVAMFKNEIGEVPDALMALKLGQSPKPGYNRFIQKEIISARLKRCGFDEGTVKLSGADGVLVTVESIVLSGEELYELGREFLREHLDELEGERNIECTRRPKDILAPVGNSITTFNIDWRSGPRSVGLASVDIDILVDDVKYTTVTIQYNLRCYTKVLVAIADILKDEAFTNNNTKVIRTEITKLHTRPAGSLKDLDGRFAKRTIRAGRAINLNDSYLPAVVQRGKMVTVIVRKGNLVIRSKAVAKRSGRIGDTIEVQNPDSGKIFRTEVTGPGKVEVVL